MKKFMIRLGLLLRRFGEWIQSDYWVCTNCSNIEYKEREIRCWNCGIGEMIYKGKMSKKPIKAKVDRLRSELDKMGIKISRIAKTYEAFCVVLHNGDVEIYIEYYFDGDIGMISADKRQKKTIENLDLDEDEVLPTILKYYE